MIGKIARAMSRGTIYIIEYFALIIELMLKLTDVTETLLIPYQRLAATP